MAPPTLPTVVALEVVSAADGGELALGGRVAGPLLSQLHAAGGATELGRPPDGPGPKLRRPVGTIINDVVSTQRRRALEMRRVEREKVRLQTAACLFLGAGGAGGPGAELRQQAVDGAALLAAASAVGPLAQLRAAAPPVIIIVLELSGKQSKRELLLRDLSRPQLSYL